MKLPRTVWYDNDGVHMLDQTRLPEAEVELVCGSVQEVWDAIKRLSVRGAPAIGVAAAFGVARAARLAHEAGEDVAQAGRQAAAHLATSRPTAVNLFWALDRMCDVLDREAQATDSLAERLEREALHIEREDVELCRAIGRHGAQLVPENATLMTHCNAGGLATAGYGTALGVIYGAVEAGKNVTVYADETRPLLQGARLTAWELQRNDVPVTVICEGAAGHVLRDKGIDLVVVGADRIAANGDTANKVGTYGLAVLAQENGVPFYVAAPTSTLDLALVSGAAIPIEERDADEIACGFGRRTAPEGVPCYNPAFDVTPARYIHGIITEHGVARAPYEVSLREMLDVGR